MAKLDREVIDARQYFKRLNRNPEEYFKRFDKLLPAGLTEKDTVCLFKIDNLGCIMKIIERNPNAKYTVFGNKAINDALKLLNLKCIVAYVDAVSKYLDRKNFDYEAFTYTCFEWSPESSQPVNFLKIGLKKGDRISIISKDGKTEYEHAFVNDGRSLIDDDGNVISLADMYGKHKETHPEQLIKRIHKKDGKVSLHCDRKTFLKLGRHIANIYPDCAIINKSDESVKDRFDAWLWTRCVVKN